MIINGTTVFAQSGVIASGGDISNNSHTISYSIGQPFTQIGTINEGLQQPYKFLIIGLDEIKISSVKVFPNPVSSVLKIQVSNESKSKFGFYSTTGQILREREFNKSTSINVNNFSKGIYFLKIFHTINDIKTFKIIIK